MFISFLVFVFALFLVLGAYLLATHGTEQKRARLQKRLSDGSRRITSISEITGMEGETITMQEIFMYERTGVDKEGTVIGRFRPTGIRPRFAERLKACGLQLPRVFFEEM